MFIFITGNDTEIGKTLVTSLIVKLLSKKNKTKKISIIKPVESGIESFAESDLGFIKKKIINIPNLSSILIFILFQIQYHHIQLH